MAAWSHNDEFLRLLETDPARMRTAAKIKQDTEEQQGKEQPKDNAYPFLIRALDGDRLLGMIDLFVPEWPHRDGWIGIGLGDRADWGQGYGTDAMRVLLRFAFAELNLHRVSLGVQTPQSLVGPGGVLQPILDRLPHPTDLLVD